MCPASFFASGLSVNDWYNDIIMCGVRKIGFSMTVLGRADENVRQWWEAAFVFYWGFCIKYLVPTVLWYMLINFFKMRIEEPYGGYDTWFQIVGIFVPAIAFFILILFMFYNVQEEPFDK